MPQFVAVGRKSGRIHSDRDSSVSQNVQRHVLTPHVDCGRGQEQCASTEFVTHNGERFVPRVSTSNAVPKTARFLSSTFFLRFCGFYVRRLSFGFIKRSSACARLGRRGRPTGGEECPFFREPGDLRRYRSALLLHLRQPRRSTAGSGPAHAIAVRVGRRSTRPGAPIRGDIGTRAGDLRSCRSPICTVVCASGDRCGSFYNERRRHAVVSLG